MTRVYLDTSALVRRAELAAQAPTPRSLHAGRPVATLLAGTAHEVATSEVGRMEFHDVVTTMWRDSTPTGIQYDAQWWERVTQEISNEISSGRLSIRNSPPRAFQRAMSNVTMATRQHNKKFRVWDAVHLITALAWSVDVGETVELWTTDGDFDGFMGLYPYFSKNLIIRNLDKPDTFVRPDTYVNRGGPATVLSM